MTVGAEGLTVLEWAQSVLTGDATLQGLLGVADAAGAAERIWEGVAPNGTPFPLVIVSVDPPVMVQGVGPGTRIMASAVLTVQAISQGESYAPLRPMAHRFVTLLHGNPEALTASGGRVMTCLYEAGVQFPEQVNGVQYRHLGSTFAVLTQ